jgi:hypothetical protein
MKSLGLFLRNNVAENVARYRQQAVTAGVLFRTTQMSEPTSVNCRTGVPQMIVNLLKSCYGILGHWTGLVQCPRILLSSVQESHNSFCFEPYNMLQASSPSCGRAWLPTSGWCSFRCTRSWAPPSFCWAPAPPSSDSRRKPSGPSAPSGRYTGRPYLSPPYLLTF